MAPSTNAAARRQPGRASKANAQGKSSANDAKAKAPASKQESAPNSSKRGPNQLLNHSSPATSKKRSRNASANRNGADDVEPEHVKKAKTVAKPTGAKAEPVKDVKTAPTTCQPVPSLPVINQVPTKILTVIVFGNGNNGELGLGPKQAEVSRPRTNPYLDPEDPSKFHVVQLVCGGMHTIALTANNKIITWGVNDENALGRDTLSGEQLRDVDADSDDDDAELNPLESTPTEISTDHFPPDTQFVQVAASDNCSLALTDTGLVFGWGTFRDPEGNRSFCHDSDGTLIEKQETPVLIQGLQKITQITCGANHALALDVHGDIWAWGSNSQNQFGRRLFGRHEQGLRPRLVRVCRSNAKYIACGEFHAFAIDGKDNVWGWGLNSYGEAGHAKTAGSDSAILPYPMKIHDLCGRGVTVISGGAHHSAAVTADGKCLAWGRLDGGQLGISFTPEQLQDAALIRHDERNKPRICLRPTPVPLVGTTTHVACGTEHTIFINDGKVHATGFGSGGQLGLGSVEEVEVAQQVRGQELKGRVMTWAGAGGQFSVVAGPA